MSWYEARFAEACKAARERPNLEERLAELRATFTIVLYRSVTRSSLEKHKILFSLSHWYAHPPFTTPSSLLPSPSSLHIPLPHLPSPSPTHTHLSGKVLDADGELDESEWLFLIGGAAAVAGGGLLAADMRTRRSQRTRARIG